MIELQKDEKEHSAIADDIPEVKWKAPVKMIMDYNKKTISLNEAWLYFYRMLWSRVNWAKRDDPPDTIQNRS